MPGRPAESPGPAPTQAERGVDGLRRAGWAALAVGTPAVVAAAALDPSAVGAAASQDWPPFVLVAGLLAVGLVARDEGLFAAAGAWTARRARSGRSLFFATGAFVAVVTALFNLDTAVAFCTPVLLVAARHRRIDETPFLYLAVFMANGASLLLPGSNLTNLIVLGRHGAGGSFAAKMALPWTVAVAAVAVVVAVRWWRTLGVPGEPAPGGTRLRIGPGALCVVVAAVAVVALTPPVAAVVVAAAGVVGLLAAARERRLGPAEVDQAVNPPMLAGLFALAVDLGTLGRVWNWPHHVLAHAGALATALYGAAAAVLVNNLPAASLLAARPPAHPDALLVGLDLGPNLAATGALSVILWLHVGRQAGARPSVVRFSQIGVVVTAVSMAAALGALLG